MTGNDLLRDLLNHHLQSDWVIDQLAEQFLTAIAHGSADSREFVLDSDAIDDRQSRRLLRPLLASLANKSAGEAGSPVNLYGGSLSFDRLGPSGPVRIRGEFVNRAGEVRVALQRSIVAEVGLAPIEMRTDQARFEDTSKTVADVEPEVRDQM